MPKASTLLFAALLFLYGYLPSAHSQTPTLVADINSAAQDLEPYFQFPMNGGFIFIGTTPETGHALWFTDGTPAGTHLVKEIIPGPQGFVPFLGSKVVNVGGTDLLFLTTDDGIHGVELWRSDGTEAGTFLIQDLNPGPAGSSPNNFALWATVSGSRVLFSASTPATGNELFYTTGELNSITLAADIRPGAASSNPRDMTKSGFSDYFSADDGTNGRELWRAGITGTVTLLKDIAVGVGSSEPQAFSPAPGGGVYFSATTVADGSEVWFSDGTGGGTAIVDDLYAGDSSPYYFVNAGSQTFFTIYTAATGGELARTDGTPAGTYVVKQIGPGAASGLSYFGPELTAALGSTLLFVADDGVNGAELWKSDGTAPGTVLVRDIYPGASSSNILYMSVFNGKAYFAAEDGMLGRELWSSDGTTQGTQPVKDIFPGAPGATPNIFGIISGALYFSSYSPNLDLWRTMGDAASTVAAASFTLGNSSTADGSPGDVGILGKQIVYRARDRATGYELWTTNSTNGVTQQLFNIAVGSQDSYPSDFTTLGQNIFFSASSAVQGTELWATDGTPAGTRLVSDIRTGVLSSGPQNFKAFGNFVYFSADDGTNGNELWRSDGSAAGTTLISDIYPGAQGSNPRSLVVAQNTLFFAAETTLGVELWKSDGTPGGAAIVKDISLGASNAFTNSSSIFAVLNNQLFFAANDGVNGSELWHSDGNAAGTTLVKDLNPGAPSSTPTSIVALGNAVLFRAFTSGSYGLWRSDGTDAGTVLVKSFPSPLDKLQVSSNRAYFNVDDGINGSEPWVTDGTEAGTFMLKDIASGAASSNTNTGLNYNNVLETGPYFFFAAISPETGDELWRTDGTAAGTVQVADLNPGPASTYTRPRAYTNGILYFSATTPAYGTELWSLLVEPCLNDPVKLTPGICGNPPTPPDLCPSDPAKVEPGVCGCGVSDLDSNLNGVFDCQFSADFKQQLDRLLTALGKIKLPKNAKQKKKLKPIVAESKALSADLNSLAKANAALIAVKPDFGLLKTVAALIKKANKVYRLKRAGFAAARKAAFKAAKELQKGLIN